MRITPSLAEIREVSWNQVEKLAAEICCSISASTFFQTSYISVFPPSLVNYSTGRGSFPQVFGGKKCVVIGVIDNR